MLNLFATRYSIITIKVIIYYKIFLWPKNEPNLKFLLIPLIIKNNKLIVMDLDSKSFLY